MTTLRELFISRAGRIALAALLALSMMPAAALSAQSAFAEESEVQQLAEANDIAATETSSDQAQSPEPDGDGDQPAAAEQRALYVAEADDAEAAGEPIEAAAADPELSEAEVAAAAEEAVEDATTDVQLDTLETTVEEPWSIFTPFRLLFGATDTFTAPLASGTHEKWIDRLDLSAAPYARTFYDLLVEGADNDGTNDWLIENSGFGAASALTLINKNAQVGKVYNFGSGATAVLAAIVDGNETATGSSLTATERTVKEYINEVYGAFDRDYPSSFWRDVQFGTVFWRNGDRTFCGFVLKNSTFDLRAQGYRSADDIRAGITHLNARVAAIRSAYEAETPAAQRTEYSRVRFYNRWICENNQYNTKFNSVASNATLLKEFQAANPDVWSAMSALSGRMGETGPVCEGYSRALELLCQADNIGCVVVDGTTGAGPHMWNYVRIGQEWYAVDITWNDTGSDSTIENYLLVGSDTKLNGVGSTFLASHPATNQFVASGTKFTNGPVLSTDAYNPNEVSFAGLITSGTTFSYGDSFALGYNCSVEGTAVYQVVSGPASVLEQGSGLPAQAAATGAGPLLSITGVGDITVKVTVTPTNSADGSATSDTITITAGPRPLKTTGTVVASKVYDGTDAASVVTAGQLVSAKTASGFASNAGVLDADSAKLGLEVKSASYLDKDAAEEKPATVEYRLVGDDATLALYTLASTTETTVGTITKRPATAFFGLSTSRVLTTEAAPTGTVRYEAFNADSGRGVVEADLAAMVPSVDMALEGMPADLVPGTYQVSWAKPNDYVLSAINKLEAAENYDVALASGDADTPVYLEVVNLGPNTIVADAEGTSGAALYRVEARVDGINDDTVTKLAEVGYTETSSIVAKLLEALAAKTGDLDANRTTTYDMTLFVMDSNGQWQQASAANFPSDGVRVTLAYPEGTAATSNSFWAAHMFTHDVESGGTTHKAGEVETPDVRNTEDGVTFTLMGFSPVQLAWNDTPPEADGSAAGSGIEGNTVQAGMSTANSSAAGSTLSQTGDSPVLIAVIAVVVIVCVALIVWFAARRKKDRRS